MIVHFNQNILCFYVPVGNTSAVGVVDAFECLVCNLGSFLLSEWVLTNNLSQQFLPLEEFSDEEVVIFHLVELVEFEDVGMIELHEHINLLAFWVEGVSALFYYFEGSH